MDYTEILPDAPFSVINCDISVVDFFWSNISYLTVTGINYGWIEKTVLKLLRNHSPRAPKNYITTITR